MTKRNIGYYIGNLLNRVWRYNIGFPYILGLRHRVVLIEKRPKTLAELLFRKLVI